MEKIIGLDGVASLNSLFGVGDANLKLLEEELKVKIALKPQGIVVSGDKFHVRKASDFLYKIAQLETDGFKFNREDICRYLNSVDVIGQESVGPGVRVPSRKKKMVLPETRGQEDYIESMQHSDIVFCTGPAGTGKTYLAMAMAVNYLTEKRVSRIILTRPAIEAAGESLGFLPGTMQEKLGPYLRPLYDALYDMMEAEVIENYLETGVIEIVPLAYMRGRTLNNAFVILDEAQNCTGEQIKMFLTRLGFESKTVITGDMTQSDLPGGKATGLMDAVKILKPIRGIKFVTLSKKDVVRHPLIQKIIQAYEDYYKEERV